MPRNVPCTACRIETGPAQAPHDVDRAWWPALWNLVSLVWVWQGRPQDGGWAR